MNDNSLFPNKEAQESELAPETTAPVISEATEEAQEQQATPWSAEPPVEPATEEAPAPQTAGEAPAPQAPVFQTVPPSATEPAAQAYGEPQNAQVPPQNYYSPYGQPPAPPYGRAVPPYQQPNPYGTPYRQPAANGNGYTVPPSRNGYGAVPPTRPPYYVAPTPPTPPVPPAPKAPKKKKDRFNWMLVLLIVGCILIGTVSGILIANSVMGPDEDRPNDRPSASDPAVQKPTQETQRPETTQPTQATQPTQPRETQPLATASGEEMTLNQIYNENVPAIVGISNQGTEVVFGQTTSTASAGSGFIISSDGEILTNYHVVEGAETLTVTLYDGREYVATLIGYEAESDVALIKIDAENLPVCAIGNSDEVFVGEQVAAIGNPMGELTYTMTVGYVSAMDRFVNTDGTPINMIQVDAAINPGNSGGPVFNLYGEVIGIATAKYSGTLGGGATLEGLGFAIPINDIVEILDDLRINGRVPDRAYMGVMVSMLPLDKETYGIDHGVFVQSVEEDGSAFKAGIQANDIILKIGDVELNAYENLQQTLRKYRAGDETTITIYRDGETLTLPIIFDAKPETTEPVTEPVPEASNPTEPNSSDEPQEGENPWETFPWDEYPWNQFPWGEFGG